MTAFEIVLTSDIVCPWCYVGRNNLLSALQLWKSRYPSSKDTFQITYAPYQLAPEFPRGPKAAITKEQFYKQRFGSLDKIAPVHARLSSIGEKAGIAFNFDFTAKVGNTRDSHRLMWLAKKHGTDVEAKVIEGLYKTFFEEAGDITDYNVLRAIAMEGGVPEQEFDRSIVESDAGGREVDEQIVRGGMEGVRGVPDFLVQKQVRFSGAQDPETIIEVLEKVRAMENSRREN